MRKSINRAVISRYQTYKVLDNRVLKYLISFVYWGPKCSLQKTFRTCIHRRIFFPELVWAFARSIDLSFWLYQFLRSVKGARLTPLLNSATFKRTCLEVTSAYIVSLRFRVQVQYYEYNESLYQCQMSDISMPWSAMPISK